MYPALLRSEVYPIKLFSYETGTSPAGLVDLAHDMGVIARVRIETEVAEYPQRTERGTRYPVGRFTTTLAGPDIVALSKHGKIIKTYECALYKMGRPFAQAMDTLLAERDACVRRGDINGEMFAKLLANSLAGKLAQHLGGWSRCSRRDGHGTWGEEREIDTVTRTVTRYRYRAGLCWRWNDDKNGAGPHTSAFAYLCAYGRQMMARIRASMPERTVVSQDTDGIWTTEAGIHSLTVSGILGREGPGSARIKGSADSAQWWGPRHYVVGGRYTVAGFREASVNPLTNEISYVQTRPLFSLATRCAPHQVISSVHTVPMPSGLVDGVVGDDGWVRPQRVLSRWREDD